MGEEGVSGSMQRTKGTLMDSRARSGSRSRKLKTDGSAPEYGANTNQALYFCNFARARNPTVCAAASAVAVVAWGNGATNRQRTVRIPTGCVGFAQSLRSGQPGRAHRPASCRAGCGRSLGVCDPHGARPRPARGACRCIYATTTHYPATGAPPHSPRRALRPLFLCPVQRLLEAEQIPHKVKPVSDYRNLGDIYVEQIANSTDVRQATPPPYGPSPGSREAVEAGAHQRQRATPVPLPPRSCEAS